VSAKNSGQRVGSDGDDGISAFWITSVANYFYDNVAAAMVGTGYWIHTRMGPIGLSASDPQYANYQSRYAMLGAMKVTSCYK
jgi:hypothetical protein